MTELNPTGNVALDFQSPEGTSWIKALEKGLSNNNEEVSYTCIQNIEMIGLFLVIFISDKWKGALR